MSVAILSDVHSNLEALQVVLAAIPDGSEVWCLGDVVGYGPNPNECLGLIRERAKVCVLGNHDVAAIDNFGLDWFNEVARDALVFTQRELQPHFAEWLDGLPYEVRLEDDLLVHGAPVKYFEYVFDKAAARRAFAATDARRIFIGHTHVAGYWALDPGGEIEHRHMQHGGTLEFEEGKRYIVDVGSVGQPRDLNPRSSFALYDRAAGRVDWKRTEYPVTRVQEKMECAHLPPFLSKRLAAGR